jgi:hypothetical protein
MRRRAGLIPAAALVFTVACGQTDAGITTDVKTSLAADEAVSAFEIDVDTQEGVVTLTGDVESPTAKAQAVQIARMTEGVIDVVDNLRIEGAAATTGFDADPSVGDRIESGARDAADAVGDAASDAADAARRGAGEVAEGAERVGSEIQDSVTDENR